VFTKRLVRAETPNLEVYYRRKERETTAKTP
jgi:hypothetical protein